MITRDQAKKEPQFSVYYQTADSGIFQKFFTKEAADNFAFSLGLLGINNYTKTMYIPKEHRWVIYDD